MSPHPEHSMDSGGKLGGASSSEGVGGRESRGGGSQGSYFSQSSFLIPTGYPSGSPSGNGGSAGDVPSDCGGKDGGRMVNTRGAPATSPGLSTGDYSEVSMPDTGVSFHDVTSMNPNPYSYTDNDAFLFCSQQQWNMIRDVQFKQVVYLYERNRYSN